MENDIKKMIPFMDELIALANKFIKPSKIVLYGSRARGDNRPTSDYDLAFYFKEDKTSKNWSEFCLEVEDELPTLCSFDLLEYAKAHEKLKSSIDKEGVVVYESK